EIIGFIALIRQQAIADRTQAGGQTTRFAAFSPHRPKLKLLAFLTNESDALSIRRPNRHGPLVGELERWLGRIGRRSRPGKQSTVIHAIGLVQSANGLKGDGLAIGRDVGPKLR